MTKSERTNFIGYLKNCTDAQACAVPPALYHKRPEPEIHLCELEAANRGLEITK